MGSIAHAKMLGKQRIIPLRDAQKIVRGLAAIEREIASGKFEFSPADEDIHMNIERRLTEKIGSAGGKLHTARSRNDQVALDMRLYLRDEVAAILLLLKTLQRELAKAAKKHLDVIMPGYTHLQRAQPVLLLRIICWLTTTCSSATASAMPVVWTGSTFYRWAPAPLPARLFLSIEFMSPSSWVFRGFQRIASMR